jgi:CRP/FNR family transcriptional regulator, cyclic AMP receptor protein
MPTSTSLSELLNSHPFLEGFTPDQIEKISTIAEIVHFDANHLIFREGDGSDQFYLLTDGWVVLEIHGPGRTYRIQTLKEGEELGWSAALPKSRKYFQARALKPVTAVALSGERLRAMWDQDCKLGFQFMRRLLGTVAERLRDTQIQLLDVFGASKPPDGD